MNFIFAIVGICTIFCQRSNSFINILKNLGQMNDDRENDGASLFSVLESL